jgi:hypothetical protein
MLKSQIKKPPIYLISEYGDLVNLKPASRAKTGRPDLRQVKLISDNMNAKELLRQLN